MISPLSHSKRIRFPKQAKTRAAFTLIEMLIVITIFLILTAVTVASFSYSINAGRVREAARQFQSYLAGARDKAIYAQDIRGVRLLLDPNDNHAVSGMQYIGAPEQDIGVLQLDTTVDPNKYAVQLISPTGRWTSLKNRGFLRAGCRIQIPSKVGAWYTITSILPQPVGTAPVLLLNQPVAALSLTSLQGSYLLELTPGILADAQPVMFPRSVQIDLDGSKVPSKWIPATYSAAYGTQAQSNSVPSQLDILFSPQGTVIGDCASAGMVHFHFADTSDIAKWHSNSLLIGRSYDTNYNTSANPLPVVPANNQNPAPSNPAIIAVLKDHVLATLTPQTGHVAVYYVNEGIVSSNTSTPIASDPYSYAETGQVANK